MIVADADLYNVYLCPSVDLPVTTFSVVTNDATRLWSMKFFSSSIEART